MNRLNITRIIATDAALNKHFDNRKKIDMKKIKLTTMHLFVILLFCVSMTIQTPAAPTLLGNGKIAFTSTRDGNQEIYLMNADGSGQTRLTNNSPNNFHPDGQPLTPESVLLRASRNAG